MADPSSYLQEIMIHYQAMLPAEILVILTVGGGIAFWKRVVRPFLDQRFKSYRQSTITLLRAKILLLDFNCSDEQRRLRALISAGISEIRISISLCTCQVLGMLFSMEAKSDSNNYIIILHEILSFFYVYFVPILHGSDFQLTRALLFSHRLRVLQTSFRGSPTTIRRCTVTLLPQVRERHNRRPCGRPFPRVNTNQQR